MHVPSFDPQLALDRSWMQSWPCGGQIAPRLPRNNYLKEPGNTSEVLLQKLVGQDIAFLLDLTAAASRELTRPQTANEDLPAEYGLGLTPPGIKMHA